MRQLYLFLTAMFLAVQAAAQDNEELTRLAAIPRPWETFPLNYKIIQPRPQYEHWNDDYERFRAMLPQEALRGMESMRFDYNGVTNIVVPTTPISHAELDTATRITSAGSLNGTWRMIALRRIRFNDSMSGIAKQIFRKDTLLEDESSGDGFMIISGNKMRMPYRKPGKTKFRNRGGGTFSLIDGRYLRMKSRCATCRSLQQVGIDESGHLIMNHVSVLEYVKQHEYISYYAVVTQYIFERMR